MNLREVIVDMRERGKVTVFCIMGDLVGNLFSIVLYNWALLVHGDTVRFYILVLYLATLLPSSLLLGP